jgi:hypothetical protein
MANKESANRGARPVKLHDHIPEILVVQLAVLFTILAALQLAIDLNWRWKPVSEHTVFWVGAAFSLLWVVSYRWNLSKKNFLIVVGLTGTFFGIPAVLEIVGRVVPETLGWFAPFSTIGHALGAFAPTASAGAYAFVALACWIITGAAAAWSMLHLRVKIDESGLTIARADGKRERYDLIGLKTETDPFDYSERAALGIGSLTLKTRAGKQIFTMKRVIGLYRIPLLFWLTPKLQRIEQLLSYQGKTSLAEAYDHVETAEAVDEDGEEDFLGEDSRDAEFDRKGDSGSEGPRSDIS